LPQGILYGVRGSDFTAFAAIDDHPARGRRAVRELAAGGRAVAVYPVAALRIE
jgi:hypothetical protein